MADSKTDLDTKFNATAESVKTFQPAAGKGASNEEKLKVYALFKQATVGDVNIDRPGGLLNYEAKAKWDAWNGVKGLAQDEAKRQYIAEVERQQKAFSS